MRSVDSIKAERELLLRGRDLAHELASITHQSQTLSHANRTGEGPLKNVQKQAEWLANKLIDARVELEIELQEAEKA